MSLPGLEHGGIGAELHFALKGDAGPRRLGLVVAETGFLFECDPDIVRVPDVTFIRSERLPPRVEWQGYSTVLPDLAVEAVSPTDAHGRPRTRSTSTWRPACRWSGLSFRRLAGWRSTGSGSIRSSSARATSWTARMCYQGSASRSPPSSPDAVPNGPATPDHSAIDGNPARAASISCWGCS